MKPRTFPPVTLDHLRSHGCRDLLVYCESIWCNHSAILNADWLPDETPVPSLCSRMVCTACGLIGADVRPDWRRHTRNGPGQRDPRGPMSESGSTGRVAVMTRHYCVSI